MENVHIVPVGLDSPDRFIEGFKRYPPSMVFFVLGKGNNPDEIAARKIKEEVEGQMGTYEKRETIALDLFTFSAALRGLFDLVEEHNRKGATFYINVSSSTKIVTQSAYMTAALSEANVRLYYVKAKDYLSTKILTALQEGKKGELTEFIDSLEQKKIVYLSNGAKDVVEIPVLKMKRPSKEDLEILGAIKENGGEVSSTAKLIRFLKGVGPKKSISTSDRNKYSKRVMQLKNAGFIVQEPEGVSKRLILTDSGEVIAEIADLLKDKKSKNGG
jgi:hypothetical protein